jgi:cytochrome c oxidase subunit 3
MGATTLTKPQQTSRLENGGRGGHSFDGAGFGGGDSWGAHEWRVPARTYRTAMWLALAAIVMLFAAFTSALVVRKGLADDWTSLTIPGILWFNTAVLLASSLTLELARQGLTAGVVKAFARGLYVTTGLGLVFVGGQLAAWRELTSRGVYLASNPSSSFFYLLTATHAVHLVGGIIALGYLVGRAPGIAAGSARRTAVDVTAIYWHFMDGLWIYILFLLWTRF